MLKFRPFLIPEKYTYDSSQNAEKAVMRIDLILKMLSKTNPRSNYTTRCIICQIKYFLRACLKTKICTKPVGVV